MAQPISPQTSDAIDALHAQQNLAAYRRSGWDSGCAISVGTSTSAVEADVDSGTVYLEGSQTSVAAGSVQLADGHIDHPRKDVVYVDSAGSLATATGDPEAPQPGDPATNSDIEYNDTYKPAPYHMADIHPSACVLGVVWVPANATESADLPSAGIEERAWPYIEGTGLTTSEGDSRYINESGDTMDGPLTAPDLDDGTNPYVTDAYVAGATVDAANHAVDADDSEDIDFSVGTTDPGAPDSGVRIWFDTSG